LAWNFGCDVLNGLFNFVTSYFFLGMVKISSDNVLVFLENRTDEIVKLGGCVKVTVSVVIVFGPDVVKYMRNNMLVISITILQDSLVELYSLFISLTKKDIKQQRRHIGTIYKLLCRPII
jgi:hypothetical protein